MTEKDEVAERPARRERKSRVLPSGFATLRDILTFVVGVAIILNEVFLQPEVEATAVAIGVAMTGLPLVFGADERRKPTAGGG